MTLAFSGELVTASFDTRLQCSESLGAVLVDPAQQVFRWAQGGAHARLCERGGSRLAQVALLLEPPLDENAGS